MDIISAIDIGTNSILLLTAKRLEDGRIVVLADEAEVTRLGEWLGRTGVLSEAAMKRTVAVLKRYLDIAKNHDSEKIVAVGTEALRRAANADVFIERVRRECCLDIEVISGEREAELTFSACAHDFGQDITVIDIGGGSTEFIAGKEKVSVKIGAVTMLEKFLHSDPVTDNEFNELSGFCSTVINTGTEEIIKKSRKDSLLVGVAGTCSTLAAIHLGLESFSHEKVHGHKMTANDLDSIIGHLRSLTIHERKKIKGLHPDRADVILPGAVILREALRLLGRADVTVSDRGIRFGLVYSIHA